MRIRYNPEARPELAAWEYYIDEPEKLRGHWAEQFARRQPMVLELGCGKGGFLAQMAPAHPEKNYIALDVKSEMLVLAKRKAEEAYAAAGVPMDNFLMTAVDIERIFLIMDETDQLDEVYIIYTSMINAIQEETQIEQLLPLKKADFNIQIPVDFKREELALKPSPEVVMDRIVPDYIVGFVYGALVESFSCEQNARMMAMEAASKSAKDMLHDLDIQYNRARQASITQEITEVIAGAKSQKKKRKK